MPVASLHVDTCAKSVVDLKNSPSLRMGHPREKQSDDLQQKIRFSKGMIKQSNKVNFSNKILKKNNQKYSFRSS